MTAELRVITDRACICAAVALTHDGLGEFVQVMLPPRHLRQAEGGAYEGRVQHS